MCSRPQVQNFPAPAPCTACICKSHQIDASWKIKVHRWKEFIHTGFTGTNKQIIINANAGHAVRTQVWQTLQDYSTCMDESCLTKVCTGAAAFFAFMYIWRALIKSLAWWHSGSPKRKKASYIEGLCMYIRIFILKIQPSLTGRKGAMAGNKLRDLLFQCILVLILQDLTLFLVCCIAEHQEHSGLFCDRILQIKIIRWYSKLQ